jgi:hypothetical protein
MVHISGKEWGSALIGAGPWGSRDVKTILGKRGFLNGTPTMPGESPRVSRRLVGLSPCVVAV